MSPGPHPDLLGWSLDVLLLACEQSFFTTGLVTAPLQPGVLELAARSSGVVFGPLSLRGGQTPCAVPSLERLAGAGLRNIKSGNKVLQNDKILFSL